MKSEELIKTACHRPIGRNCPDWRTLKFAFTATLLSRAFDGETEMPLANAGRVIALLL